MGRLLGVTAKEVQKDRFAAARKAAEMTHSTVVLKGAGSVLATHRGLLRVNLTGNPGMATGGMGDVLAGLMAGLAAQGVAPESAAAAAVYLHGRAADLAVRRGAEASLTAGDVVDALPYAWRELR
jgi:NAD(P)H-hydrate epimerase